MGEVSLLSKIQKYSICEKMVREYTEAIKSKNYGTGSSCETACGGCRTPYSKVEKRGIELHSLKEKIAENRQEIALVRKYINHSGLSKEEREILWLVAKNLKLLPYAKEKGIDGAKVYKIRDRAIRKIKKVHNLS